VVSKIQKIQNFFTIMQQSDKNIYSDITRRIFRMLELPIDTRQAALQYFTKSIKFDDRDLSHSMLLAASISIACKCTNTFRKQRDIINVVHFVLFEKELPLNDLYWNLKDSLSIHEDLLLRILSFDTNYANIYQKLVLFLQEGKIDTYKSQVCFTILLDFMHLKEFEFKEVDLCAVVYLMLFMVGVEKDQAFEWFRIPAIDVQLVKTKASIFVDSFKISIK
jgi:hypothetical protein